MGMNHEPLVSAEYFNLQQYTVGAYYDNSSIDICPPRLRLFHRIPRQVEQWNGEAATNLIIFAILSNNMHQF